MNNHQLVNQTSGNTEYYTPKNIIAAVKYCLGYISLDPASSKEANKVINALVIFTKDDDGLSHDWYGKVWMNHPFGKKTNSLWIDKLVGHFLEGKITEACCITYACTSEKWFRPLLSYPQCFLYPRTNYLLPDGNVKRGVTKGSVVTYLGHDWRKFQACFSHLGVVKL